MLSKLLPLVSILPFVLGAPAFNPVSGPSGVTPVFSAPVSATPTITNSTTYPASASTSGASTQSGFNTITLSSYPFIPFPTPTLNPRPPVFPATDPSNPPDVCADPQIVPDFAPAWATAYKKATNFVRESPLSTIASFFNHLAPMPRSRIIPSRKKSISPQASVG